MGFLDTLGRWFVPQPEHYRDAYEFPDLSEQMAAIRRAQAGARPWRPASVEEALGVPSILGAVTLISNTVGSLSMEAFQNGSLVSEQDRIPTLIQRPNPHTTPREFFRNTAFYLATRGEAWWWVAVRDLRDDTPLSLFPVPPWEIMVEPNSRNVLEPTIKWNNREIRREDMRHITYLPGSDGRGKGPLQHAGAAVSVGVEADNWAANFFSGALPSIVGQTDMELDEQDTLALDRQWLEKPNNLPRWMDKGIKLGEPPFNAEKAQLTETRQFQVTEVARMFTMPGDLLEAQQAGTSLRYRNDETLWTDFQRRCLSPNYLEPIEQAMSDLLPRSWHSEFNLEGLLRADIKTRSEVYERLVNVGVMLPEEARTRERLAPGNPDVRPVPPAVPRSVVSRLPYERSAHDLVDVRCPSCNRIAGQTLPGHYAQIVCKKCGTMARSLDAA